MALRMFPTPNNLKITNSRNEKLYKRPRFEFAKIIERENKTERKITVRKSIFAKIEAGSTKMIVRTRMIQRKIVTASVGRKFFLRLTASFLFSFFMHLYLGYNKMHLWI